MAQVNIAELATEGISLSDFFAKANTAGVASKNTIQNLMTLFETVGEVGFKGSISAGTYASKTAGWYFATNTGDYIMGSTTIAVDVSDTLTIIIVPTVINDSSKVEVPISGITIDSTIIDGSTNAVSGNAVFDGLALKQDTLTFDSRPTLDSENSLKSKDIFNLKPNAKFFDDTITVNEQILLAVTNVELFGLDATKFYHFKILNNTSLCRVRLLRTNDEAGLVSETTIASFSKTAPAIGTDSENYTGTYSGSKYNFTINWKYIGVSEVGSATTSRLDNSVVIKGNNYVDADIVSVVETAGYATNSDVTTAVSDAVKSPFYLTGDLINVTTSGNCTIPSNTSINILGTNFNPTNRGATIAIPTSVGVTYYLIYNKTSNAYEVVVSTTVLKAEVNVSKFLLATFQRYATNFKNFVPMKFQSLQVDRYYDLRKNIAIFEDGEFINFRLTKLKIDIPSSIKFGSTNTLTVPTNAGATLDISATIDMRYLVYDSVLNQVKIINGADLITNIESDTIFFIAKFRSNNFVDSRYPFLLNGLLYNSGKLQNAKDLPILPKKVYFVENEPRNIYKSSMIGRMLNIETIRMAIADNTNLKFDYFYDSHLLNPATLGTDLAFKVKTRENNINESFHYTQPFTKNNKNIVDVINTTPKLLFIGDSLMASDAGNRSLRLQLRDNLLARSITPTFVGTGLDANSLRSDAVGGYSYLTQIGRNCFNGTDAIVPTASGLSTKADLRTNSFLRLADATDKTNNPQWCFTNTGSTYETSYAENPALGDYYIFDFAWYLTNHSVTTPDVIHISSSTNDIVLASAPYSESADAMEWMISQIRVALPTTPITVLPYHHWGDSYETSSALMSFASLILDKIEDIADANVHVNPAFAFMAKYFIFPQTQSTFADRNYNKSTINDIIHPSELGYKIMAKEFEALTINLL